MRRQDKYPDTATFHYYNANPHNRITSDCTVRAVCTALEQDYKQTAREMLEMGLACGLIVGDPNLTDRYLSSKGWRKCPQPRKSDNTKYTGAEFCRLRKAGGNIVAHVGGHHIVAIVNKRIWDVWDSTDGCVGNYWVKE